MRVQNVGILQRAANMLIFGLENVIVIWLAALLVMEGKFTVGMLYAFIGFKLLFLTRVVDLIDKWNEFRMLDLHAERIADIALSEPEGSKPAMPRGRRHRARCTSKRRPGLCLRARGLRLQEVDLTIATGESIAIVGPSGCGKTTLIKVLLGLLKPTEGEVRVNGRNLADWDTAQYRARVGAVMQDDQLFVGTIEDNISFFDTEHDPARVRECARAAMIDEEIMAMPMQYNTIVGSLGMALSGGQKQRVLLARALYRKPQVLFLDEAFDQLDSALERTISLTLLRQAGALVVISHREETISAQRKKLAMDGRLSTNSSATR